MLRQQLESSMLKKMKNLLTKEVLPSPFTVYLQFSPLFFSIILRRFLFNVKYLIFIYL